MALEICSCPNLQEKNVLDAVVYLGFKCSQVIAGGLATDRANAPGQNEI